MDERTLIERLEEIEAKHAGLSGPAGSPERSQTLIRDKLTEITEAHPPIEWKFSLTDPWERKLFLALCRRYGLQPFRYTRQQRQSVMLRVPRPFVDGTLWPLFVALRQPLYDYLAHVTDRVIGEALQADTADAEENQAQHELPL
ncbi:MAG TPA: hypothetical protein ENK18_08055 [Deltaproteobacteria bacterium]|nr:hypothetical protein [Deltaproteobacteria bacterium]